LVELLAGDCELSVGDRPEKKLRKRKNPNPRGKQPRTPRKYKGVEPKAAVRYSYTDGEKRQVFSRVKFRWQRLWLA